MRVIKQMPRKRFGHKPESYPWEQYLDGQARQFTRGIDFKVSVRTFRTLAERAAGVRGKRANVVMKGDDVFIQAGRVST